LEDEHGLSGFDGSRKGGQVDSIDERFRRVMAMQSGGAGDREGTKGLALGEIMR